MAAVVLAALQFARFWVDGYAFAVRPVAFGLIDGVAEGLEGSDGAGWEAGFQVECVGQVLVMEAGGVDCLLDVQAALGG